MKKAASAAETSRLIELPNSRPPLACPQRTAEIWRGHQPWVANKEHSRRVAGDDLRLKLGNERFAQRLVQPGPAGACRFHACQQRVVACDELSRQQSHWFTPQRLKGGCHWTLMSSDHGVQVWLTPEELARDSVKIAQLGYNILMM